MTKYIIKYNEINFNKLFKDFIHFNFLINILIFEFNKLNLK